MSKKVNKWALLWEQRGREYPLNDPVKLDGYDNPGVSDLGGKSLEVYFTKILEGLQLTKDDFLLEVGCGAGMFVGRLAPLVKKAVGCDIAKSMIERAKKLFPDIEFGACEANKLPYESHSFTKVLVAGVFNYFPGLAYAEQCLTELDNVCKSGGRIMITSLNDEGVKEAALKYRASLPTTVQPWRSSFKPGELKYFFYRKELFKEFFGRKGYTCVFSQQDIPGYGNAPYRFNILAIKNAKE